MNLNDVKVVLTNKDFKLENEINYAVLETPKLNTSYVVASGYKITDNNIEWNHGSYVDSLPSALLVFEEKVTGNRTIGIGYADVDTEKPLNTDIRDTVIETINHYIAFTQCDMDVNYTLYNKYLNEIDGGVIEFEDRITLEDCKEYVFNNYNEDLWNEKEGWMQELDYESFMDVAEKVEEKNIQVKRDRFENKKNLSSRINKVNENVIDSKETKSVEKER